MRTPLVEGDIPVRFAAELLAALAEEVFADVEPPRVFEDVSLHDLFDLDVEDREDPSQDAVDMMFPESLLFAAEEGIDIPRDTPPALEPPMVLSPLRQQRQDMPNLSVGEVNLVCSESSFSSLEENELEKCMAELAASGAASVREQEREEMSGTPFNLDCPELPGYGCKSCQYHREQTGEADILCSLCYLRRNGVFVYSKSWTAWWWGGKVRVVDFNVFFYFLRSCVRGGSR